jgi:hypothetical protein
MARTDEGVKLPLPTRARFSILGMERGEYGFIFPRAMDVTVQAVGKRGDSDRKDDLDQRMVMLP